jgi:hypothetical protein
MILAAVARTAFLPSVGRNNGILQDACAFKIGHAIPKDSSAVLETKVVSCADLASALAMAWLQKPELSVGRNNGSLQDVCAFKNDISNGTYALSRLAYPASVSRLFEACDRYRVHVGSSMLDTDRGSSTTGRI